MFKKFIIGVSFLALGHSLKATDQKLTTYEDLGDTKIAVASHLSNNELLKYRLISKESYYVAEQAFVTRSPIKASLVCLSNNDNRISASYFLRNFLLEADYINILDSTPTGYLSADAIKAKQDKFRKYTKIAQSYNYIGADLFDAYSRDRAMNQEDREGFYQTILNTPNADENSDILELQLFMEAQEIIKHWMYYRTIKQNPSPEILANYLDNYKKQVEKFRKIIEKSPKQLVAYYVNNLRKRSFVLRSFSVAYFQDAQSEERIGNAEIIELCESILPSENPQE